jgi:hypothetical protein
MKIVRTFEKPVGVICNPATGLMVMDFADRGRYIYYDVPRGVFDTLKSVPVRVHAEFVNNAGHNYSVIEGVEAC